MEEFRTITSPAARPEWLASLVDEGRAGLRGRYNHFLALSEAEQARLHDLQESVTHAEDSEQLVETMLAYQSWLNMLPASQQFELREMPADRRIDEVVGIQRREADNNWITLSSEEMRHLRLSLLQLRTRMLEGMSREERARFESSGVGGRWLMASRQDAGFREAWRAEAIAALSPEHREQFDSLAPDAQQKQLFHWVRQVAMRESRESLPGKRRRFDAISQAELERFFSEDIDAATRERLLAQPRDRMEQQLRNLYLRSEFPDLREFPRGRERPGPPRPPQPAPPQDGPRDGFGPPRWDEDRGGNGPPEERGLGRPPHRGRRPRPGE